VGRTVGILQLAENLRLPEDQRVESRRDGEDVLHGGRPVQFIAALAQVVPGLMIALQPVGQLAAAGSAIDDAVHLGAVAGGHDEAFLHARPGAQVVQRLGEPRGVENDAFPDFHGRSSMIQAQDEDRHGAPVR